MTSQAGVALLLCLRWGCLCRVLRAARAGWAGSNGQQSRLRGWQQGVYRASRPTLLQDLAPHPRLPPPPPTPSPNVSAAGACGPSQGDWQRGEEEGRRQGQGGEEEGAGAPAPRGTEGLHCHAGRGPVCVCVSTLFSSSACMQCCSWPAATAPPFVGDQRRGRKAALSCLSCWVARMVCPEVRSTRAFRLTSTPT